MPIRPVPFASAVSDRSRPRDRQRGVGASAVVPVVVRRDDATTIQPDAATPRAGSLADQPDVTTLHSQRKSQMASKPAAMTHPAITRRLDVCGTSPAQLADIACTAAPLGVALLTVRTPSGITSSGT